MSQSRSHQDKTESLHSETPADAPSACEERLNAAARSFSENRDEPSFNMLYGGAKTHMVGAVRRAGVLVCDVDGVVNTAAMTIWTLREKFTGERFSDFVAFAVTIAQRAGLNWRRQGGRLEPYTAVPKDPRAPVERTTPRGSSWALVAMFTEMEELAPLTDRQSFVVRARDDGWNWEAIGEENRYGFPEVFLRTGSAL